MSETTTPNSSSSSSSSSSSEATGGLLIKMETIADKCDQQVQVDLLLLLQDEHAAATATTALTTTTGAEVTTTTTTTKPFDGYDELYSLVRIMRRLKTIRGYLFGILFALSMCMSNILVKMSPRLDGSDLSAIRYLIQLFVMFFFIKKNRLDYLGPRKQRSLLVARGVVGCAAVIISFFSIRYMDVSDVETLNNSCVLITAIIARLVLNEKLSMAHVVAVVLNVTGVVFIVRPAFLFGIEENLVKLENIVFHLNVTSRMPSAAATVGANVTSSISSSISGVQHHAHKIIDHSNRELVETAIGVTLVLVSATCMSVAQVSIRKLCLAKCHFSITSIYPAYVGLPSSVLVSLLLVYTQASQGRRHALMLTTADVDGSEEMAMQIIYAIFAGVFGTLGIIFLSESTHTLLFAFRERKCFQNCCCCCCCFCFVKDKALRYEDPTKIGMVKMSGVLFSFILQYWFLDIAIDFLGVIGALCVVSGVLFVMLAKLYEKKLHGESSNPFVKFLFYKF